jgi:mono/diheme cytochrome c family protein
MRRPFQPEAVSSPAPAAVDPLAAKGAVIFAAGPCGDCHGESGGGTAAAPALIGIGQKYSSDRLAFLLHHRTPNMIAGGMPPVDLNQADTAALVAYLRSLK